MGAVGAIVIDGTAGTSSSKDGLFHMSGDTAEGVPPKELIELPFVFLFHEEGKALLSAMTRRWRSEAKPAVALISKENDGPSK